MSVGVIIEENGVLVNRRYATKGVKTVTDKGFFGFDIIEGHLWLIYGAVKPDVRIDENRHLILNFDGNVPVEEMPPRDTPLGDVIDPLIVCEYDKIRIRWSDPKDVVYKGVTIAEWAGTLLVRKEGVSSLNPEDGEILLDSKTRDEYKTKLFDDVTVNRSTEYFYTLFPYTTEGVYTMSDRNVLAGALSEDYVIGDPYNIRIYVSWEQFQIDWADPEDLIIDGIVRASWVKTTIVKNTEHYPESIDDGTIFYENTKRSTYNVQFDRDLENDIKYYYGFFVTTIDGKVKKSLLARLEGTAIVNLKWSMTKIGTYGFKRGHSEPYVYTSEKAVSTSYISESRWTVEAKGGETFVLNFEVDNYYFACDVTVTINGETVLNSERVSRHTVYGNRNTRWERNYERVAISGTNAVQIKIVPVQTSSTNGTQSAYVKFVRKVDQI